MRNYTNFHFESSFKCSVHVCTYNRFIRLRSESKLFPQFSDYWKNWRWFIHHRIRYTAIWVTVRSPKVSSDWVTCRSVLLKQNCFRHFSMIGEMAQLVHKKSDKYGNNAVNNVQFLAQTDRFTTLRSQCIIRSHWFKMYVSWCAFFKAGIFFLVCILWNHKGPQYQLKKTLHFWWLEVE